jgi:serine acetyltransferase
VLGQDVTIRHGTTLGERVPGSGTPTILDGVNIGANAIIIGDVVIGTGASIGAGSVVTRSVDTQTSVAGNPCRVLHGPARADLTDGGV